MRDWQEGRLRYLVHFSDSGTDVRFRDTWLDTGDELTRERCTTSSSAWSSRGTDRRWGTRGCSGSATREDHASAASFLVLRLRPFLEDASQLPGELLRLAPREGGDGVSCRVVNDSHCPKIVISDGELSLDLCGVSHGGCHRHPFGVA